MSTPNNPPAYPGPSHTPGYGNAQPHTLPYDNVVWQEMSPGMTLLDYFAAKALQGLLGREFRPSSTGNTNTKWMEVRADGEPQWLASKSYEYASAMLAEREKHL